MAVQTTTFRPLYLRWIIVLVILLVMVLVLLKVVPGSDTLWAASIIGLCVAIVVP